MGRRCVARTTATTVAALALAASCGSWAADAAVPRQVGSIHYTTTAPGAPTGTVVDWRFQNPENPKLKPHTAIRMVVHSPVGGLIDTTAPPQCHASDAQLMVQGPPACPKATQVGSGLAVSDTGGGGPFPRYSEATITNFNNQDEVIGVGEVKAIPLLKPVDRTKINGRTETTDFPLFPGAPPPDPYTPFKSLHVVFPKYVRNGRPYMRTPRRCPAVRYWTMTTEFTYADGVKQVVVSRSPCKPAPTNRPHRGHGRGRRPALHDEGDRDD